jgi:AcrR family transcriptional regulator
MGVGRDELVSATRKLLKTISPRELSRLGIARFAGVDPALVRYYFGNKEGLLTAVTAELSKEMHSRMAAGERAARTFEEKLYNRIEAMLDVHAENPHLNELIIRQILYGARKPAKMARREMISDSVASMRRFVDIGTQDGAIRDVDPRLLHIAIVGMCDFFFTGRPVLEELFGRGAAKPDLVKAYGKFIHELILNGLKVRSRPRARKPKAT